MTQATWLVAIFSGLSLLALSAQAGAPPPARQLRSDCKSYVDSPDSPDGRRCMAYIQGFLDGANAASRPPAQAAADPKRETFSERALRTRLRERDWTPPRPDAGICVPDAVPTADVVTQVIAHLDTGPPSAEDTAATLVHAALVARFPCGPAPR